MMRAVAAVAVLLFAVCAHAERVVFLDDIPGGGASVAGFAGERNGFEVVTTADCVFKIQMRVSGSWVDREPDGGSPSDTFPLFAGGSWSQTFGNYAGVADSTRVLVTPSSTADVIVVAR